MNPVIRIQRTNGALVNFELQEQVVSRNFGPSKLLELMMALYQAQTFKNLTSLEMLPLSNDLESVWREERHVPWNEKIMQPTVEWRFEERFFDTTQVNGPPMAIVNGDVDHAVFSRVVSDFFGSTTAIASIHH